jgi:hypothetical protein
MTATEHVKAELSKTENQAYLGLVMLGGISAFLLNRGRFVLPPKLTVATIGEKLHSGFPTRSVILDSSVAEGLKTFSENPVRSPIRLSNLLIPLRSLFLTIKDFTAHRNTNRDNLEGVTLQKFSKEELLYVGRRGTKVLREMDKLKLLLKEHFSNLDEKKFDDATYLSIFQSVIDTNHPVRIKMSQLSEAYNRFSSKHPLNDPLSKDSHVKIHRIYNNVEQKWRKLLHCCEARNTFKIDAELISPTIISKFIAPEIKAFFNSLESI